MESAEEFDPDTLDDMAAVMAALGVSAQKLTVNQLFGRPDLKRRMKRLDPYGAALSFAGLLTIPKLAPNALRLEAMVHAALALGHGNERVDEKLAAEVFRYLGTGHCGQMEDPSEDLLVGTVRTSQGNFRVLQGVWEGGCFFLQRFLDVMETMPAGVEFDAIRTTVTALLRLSDAVCERGGLRRFELGGEFPVDKLSRKDIGALLPRGTILRFSRLDLDLLGINTLGLTPFIFDMRHQRRLVDERPGNTTLERSPLIANSSELSLALPTAVSAAIRYFILTTLGQAGYADSFKRGLMNAYTKLFKSTPLLGGDIPPAIPFSRNTGFGEAILEFDQGYYLHLLFFMGSLANIETDGLAGVDQSLLSMGQEFDGSVKRACKGMSQRPGFRAGISLIVGCGAGQGAVIAFGEEEMRNWRVVSCPAHDLITLSETPNFKTSNLWRILDARDKTSALGLRLQNINGLLNLVAWVRNLDGHLVPQAHLPDGFVEPDHRAMVSVIQNSQRKLRYEAAIATDLRVERFVDGQPLRLRRDGPSLFADDDLRPLYASEDMGPNGKPLSAFLSKKRVWWAYTDAGSTAPGVIAYERWRTVGTWLTRAADVLDDLPGLPAGPLLWEAIFETASDELRATPPRQSYYDARESIRVSVNRDSSTIKTVIGPKYEDAQFHEENIAERALAAALIHGAALLANHPKPETVEADILPLVVKNSAARHGHAFAANDFRDQLRPALRQRVVTISKETDAFTRLGLGWSVRQRSQGPRLVGKEDCNRFLNALVIHIEAEVVGELRQYDRGTMLGMLLANHERAVSDRDQWQRTSAAQMGLHGDTPENRKVMVDRQFKLNAVFQASKTLAEIALCECPLVGGRTPGDLDLELLMARAVLLFTVGGWSDAVRWDLMKPELRITPLGDVHADFDFHDEVVIPHARMVTGGRIEAAITGYARNLAEPSITPTTVDRLDADFGEAWAEHFGATFDETRVFVDFVENLGIEAGAAVLTIPRSRITGSSVEIARKQLPNDARESLLASLTLSTRPAWGQVPQGFTDRDRQPWRFRRRLSLIQRPILQVDDLPDPTLIVAPGMLRDAFTHTGQLLYRGDLPADQLSPKMLAWRSRVTGARGTAFAKEVAAALESVGWATRVEVKVTELLRQGFDRDYGDVDVLAWKAESKRVLIIECKDVLYSKTLGEIAEQLADFRGQIRPNGRRDELRRHLDRMDIIRMHLSKLSRFVGISDLQEVESHLVFRHPVPMEFALVKMAEQVTVSRLAIVKDI